MMRDRSAGPHWGRGNDVAKRTKPSNKLVRAELAPPERHPTKWATSFLQFLGALKQSGRKCLLVRGRPTDRRPWLCSPERHNQGCGFAKAAMGPFYCPIDEKVYLDTEFFQDLERRFRACDAGSKSCQFSEAYVIAHEDRAPRPESPRTAPEGARCVARNGKS
jgi:hypothetical protein